MSEHHAAALADLEARGTNANAVSEETLIVEHLSAAELHVLRASHAEVEFILDKTPGHIATAEQELGLASAYLSALEQGLDEPEERTRSPRFRNL